MGSIVSAWGLQSRPFSQADRELWLNVAARIRQALLHAAGGPLRRRAAPLARGRKVDFPDLGRAFLNMTAAQQAP